jgi:hypothetical protein
MMWLVYVAHFFGGAFLANAVPHFVNGISGRPFPSPFASPPGKGESSPLVNVLWGAFNIGVGYLLVYHVGSFVAGRALDVAVVGIGGLLMALTLAWSFGRAGRR